jgi:hypothetical protein
MTLPKDWGPNDTNTERIPFKDKLIDKLKLAGIIAVFVGIVVMIVGDLTAGIWGPMLGLGK